LYKSGGRPGVHRKEEEGNQVGYAGGSCMNADRLLLYGLAAAGILVLWLLFKVVKKVLLVILITVAIVGIALGLYLKFF
jgi:hypothetical protein